MELAPSPATYPIRWQGERVWLIDQTRLPQEYQLVEINSCEEMARAIETMVVRGAPAIGIAAAYGLFLGAREIAAEAREDFFRQLAAKAQRLRRTRPTAANLFWAIARLEETARQTPGSVAQIRAALLEAAKKLQAEDLETCQRIGACSLSVLPAQPEKLRLLTHCNAGALATAGYGTALGAVRAARAAGRLARVYADETRPRLQGAKLTAWECVQEGIPVTVIADGTAAHCLKLGMVDAIFVGADRIAANGDVANKIGTYSLALAAQAHGVPFFVAAPLSTVDFDLPDGSQIPIEERDPAEIYRVGETRLCPEGVDFFNPAFDVTPAAAIAAIVTEVGAVKPEDLKQLALDARC